MKQLAQKYIDRSDQIKEAIQQSEILERYLTEEEAEIFQELRTAFEPSIDELHQEVAAADPLQLIAFERELIDPGFEGLYLPRVLGYTVLRGEINANFKYVRPQNHFKEVLLSICNSPNFDVLKQRIGQSIQVGFALSSDIWITNLIQSVENKLVSAYLESLVLEKFRDVRSRHTSYSKYKKQFSHFNFQTAEFPQNVSELTIMGATLKDFLIYRAGASYDNSSLSEHIRQLIASDSFKEREEYLELLMIVSMFYDQNKEDAEIIHKQWNALRKSRKDFHLDFFRILSKLIIDPEVKIGSNQDLHIGTYLDSTIQDELSKYYHLMNIIHSKGYVHNDSIEAVRDYYDHHKGLSIQNQCVRLSIYQYFHSFLSNLDTSSYHDYIEINNVFIQYMGIFSNEKFNQRVKGLSFTYIKKLLKVYTDKRGKDYQDIKKFVSTVFVDLNFLKPKEVVELFKTRRKKKEA